MDTEEELQKVIDKYQDDASLAALSGQIDEWFVDNTGLTTEQAADLVGDIGSSCSREIIEDIAVSHFDIPEDQATDWAKSFMGPEFQTILSHVGTQVGVHAFIIGYLLAKKRSEINA